MAVVSEGGQITQNILLVRCSNVQFLKSSQHVIAIFIQDTQLHSTKNCLGAVGSQTYDWAYV